MNYAQYRAEYRRKWYNAEPGEANINSDASFGHFTLRTQAEVARKLHITRQAVQQIERRALRKIRDAMQEMWKECQ